MQKIRRVIKLYRFEIFQAAAIVITVILLLTVIFPQLQRQWYRFTLMQETQKDIQNLKEKQALLASFDQSELENTYKGMMSVLPKDKALGTMMSGIDKLATDYGMTLVSFSFDSVGSIGTQSATKKTAKKETTVYSTVPITVTVEGTLTNIKNFLDSANRTRPLYLIKNFDLTFSPKDATFRSKILLDGMYLPLPKTLGSVSSSLTPFSDREVSIITKVTGFSEITRIENQNVNPFIQTSPVKADPFAQ